jgi:hypothetical protein
MQDRLQADNFPTYSIIEITNSPPQDTLMTKPKQTFIIEPEREIPVIYEPDLLVVGGGPAGIAAALAASRCGFKTLIVERYNHLGGLWTGGLVLPLLSTHAVDQMGEKQKVIFGIADEISSRLRDMGMAIREENPVVDPEAAKYLFDRMVEDAGIQVLFHCWASNVIMSSHHISAVMIESKSGRVAIQPRFVIDATGDGDIFAAAGEDFTNLPYNIGLIHRIGNVDKLDAALVNNLGKELGDPTPIPGVHWVNMRGEDGSDGLDIHTLSSVTMDGRRTIWEKVRKIKQIPGCEDVFLLDTASQTGVRVTRILKGQYELTLDDSFTFKQFPDVIGVCGAWREMSYQGEIVPRAHRPLWQIPLRSLIPQKTANLVVAGRCFSYEKALVEDARIIGAALLTGQAAGVAAAVCLKNDVSIQEADARKVQKILLDQNVFLG